jgi:phage/plasmid-associated DNA primase
LTIEETKEIYWYDEQNGKYVPRGDTIIEKYAETLDPEISTHKVNEIVNKVRRRTYVRLEEFESDPNIINFKNGLYHIQSGKLTDHTPNYLSMVQVLEFMTLMQNVPTSLNSSNKYYGKRTF